MADSKDYLISLLKDKYEHEMSRRRDFESSLNIPITLLTALFVGVYYVATDSTVNSQYCSLNAIKWILIIGIFLTSALTMIFLFIVYFGFKRSYCVFPKSTEVHNDYKGLESYCKEHFSDTYESSLTDQLNNHAIQWYLQCNKHNTPLNDKRGNALFNARLCVCIGLSMGLLLLTLTTVIKVL